MRILHIIPAYKPAHVYGGPVESTFYLCRYLAVNGCDVRVLTTDANGPKAVLDVKTDHEVQIATGVRVRYCHRWIGNSVTPTLLRLLPSYIHWADVVYLSAVYSFPTIPTLFLCKISGKPLVWSPHGALQRWKGSTHPMLKAVWEWVCRMAAPKKLTLHVTSKKEAKDSLERLPDVEIAVIPNGIEIPDQLTRVPRSGALRLLYLGRLHPIKGIENILASCKLLNSFSSVTWSLTIAGSGDLDYVESLRVRIEDLMLARQVQMVGAVEGEIKQSLFENTDIVIVPSHTENFGMVIAEALAHGVPVVASKGTPWKRVEEIGCGLWVENDPESLAKAIERMTRMPLREMGERGRKWMQNDFTWDSKAKSMIKLFRSLVG
ncbi:MAG TPA: glycosyltransferase [Nitrospiria bacterium]|nr:glycosyltransferase [Nitrospiria bacterium]